MSKREQALEYNTDMREALQLLWAAMPKGQQKQAVKQPRLKAALLRYKIIVEEETNE